MQEMQENHVRSLVTEVGSRFQEEVEPVVPNGPHIFPLCLEWILPDATHHSLGRAVPCLAADKSSNLGQSFSGTFPTKTELYLTSAPLRAAKQSKHQLTSSQCQRFPPAKRIQTAMLNYQVLRVTMRARESTDNVEPFILALDDQPPASLTF